MNVPLFAPIIDHRQGRPRRVQVVKCGSCPSTLEFGVNTRANGGMADETIMRKAKLKGWDFRRSGRDVTCPACERQSRVLVVTHKLAKDPEAVFAGYGGSAEQMDRATDRLRVEAVLAAGAPSLQALEHRIAASGAGDVYDEIELPAQPKEPPPMSTTAPPRLVPPREPSREDKRRILDRLSEVYVSEETGYAADWSDAKLAASLSVPPAWVKDLREEFHGENAGNEAGDAQAKERRRAINELKADAARIEQKLMTALADGERELSSVKARIAKLEGGAS